MHIVINTFKVAWGLVIVAVCITGLAVIMKSDTRRERRNAKRQRAWLYYDSNRRTADD